MLRRASTLALLLALPGLLRAADPIVKTTLTPAEAVVGDRLTLTVVVEHGPEAVIQPPEWDDLPEEWTILSKHPAKAEAVPDSGLTRETFTYDVAFYDLKVTEWPQGKLTWREAGEERSVVLDAIAVKVKSIAPEDAKEIMPDKGQQELKYPWWYWAAGGVVLALLIAGAWWALRRYERSAVKALGDGEDRLPPDQEALAALKRIEKAQYPARGETQRHYFEVSETVRRYIERRYGFPALEATTEEIAALLPEHVKDETRLIQAMDLMRHADFVKFARLDPGRERAEALVAEARAWIEADRPPVSETPKEGRAA